MTIQIASLLTIIGLSLVLFWLERFPAEVIGLGVLLTLVLTGLLPAEQAFAGFGSDTVMMILGLFILAAALVRTGVVDWVTRAIRRRAGDDPRRLLLTITITAGILSALMSNTATAAFLVPVALTLARRARFSASKLLMPLAFATVLASSVTLISTTTNVVVSGLMADYGLDPLAMFELAPVGIPILVVGLLYMFLLGNRMIPERAAPDESIEESLVHPYLTEIVLLPDSPLVGKNLAASGLGRDLDLTVVRVLRDGQRYLAPRGNLHLQENDVLLVEGRRDEILKVKDLVGMAIKPEVKLADPLLETERVGLVEAIVLPPSPLIGRTLRAVDFRKRYGAQVLAINRRGETILRKISRVRLQTGDQLLIQGNRANLSVLEESRIVRIVGTVESQRPDLRRAPLVVAIFAAVLVVAGLDILPLAVVVLLGAVLAFVTGCVTPDEAYRSVQWKALILIGSMLAVGNAMEYTGTASYLATQIVNLTHGAHPAWLLTAVFFLTMLLTQPLSNQAAAIVVIPIALEAAVQAGYNPRSFAVMIALGASCSFITPLEPACLMVYGPGHYRFSDFVKVGSLLTVLIYLLAIFMVPLLWPL